MRIARDSTAAADIPAVGCDLILGYIDGSFAWSDEDWALFPGKTLVRICVFSDRLDAQVLDIEEGNNDAAGAVPWVAAKWARGETPTVYCYTDRGPVGYRISDVRAACVLAGVREPLFIVANYDNIPVIPEGCIGKQYANPTYTGGHYDESVVADHWPGVDLMPDCVTREEFEAYQRDVRETIKAMKRQYDPIAEKFPKHSHDTSVPKPQL